MLGAVEDEVEMAQPVPCGEALDSGRVAEHDPQAIAALGAQVGEGLGAYEREIALDLAGGGGGLHFDAGVDYELREHVRVALESADDRPSRASGHLPVDVADLVAGRILCEVLEVVAFPGEDRRVRALEEPRGLPDRRQ